MVFGRKARLPHRCSIHSHVIVMVLVLVKPEVTIQETRDKRPETRDNAKQIRSHRTYDCSGYMSSQSGIAQKSWSLDLVCIKFWSSPPIYSQSKHSSTTPLEYGSQCGRRLAYYSQYHYRTPTATHTLDARVTWPPYLDTPAGICFQKQPVEDRLCDTCSKLRSRYSYHGSAPLCTDHHKPISKPAQ